MVRTGELSSTAHGVQARRGEDVAPVPRAVTISELKLLEWDPATGTVRSCAESGSVLLPPRYLPRLAAALCAVQSALLSALCFLPPALLFHFHVPATLISLL